MTERAVRNIVAFGFLAIAFSLLGGESVEAARIRPFGQRANLVNSVGRRGAIFGRGNFNIDVANNFEPVNGFSNLVKVGNAILEQRVLQNGQLIFNRLFIDSFGRLIGATALETVRQLQEFFLQNFQGFGRAAQQTIGRFLLRDPATANALLGNVNIDLKAFPFPDSWKKEKRLDYAMATLRFCLNSINPNFLVTPAQLGTQNIGPDGVLHFNARAFGMRPDAIALLFNQRENFTDCEGRNVFNLSTVIERCTDNTIYYQALGLDKKLKGLGQQIGVAVDPRQTTRNKTLIAGTSADAETNVGVNPQRLLERQPELNNPGGCYRRSYDFFGTNASGAKRRSKDILRAGVNFTQDADEFIFTLPNGFNAFYLANAAGDRQDFAPASIAFGGIPNAAGRGNQEVNNPISCLDCHANGFIGGTHDNRFPPKDHPYTDHLKNGDLRVDRGFFSSNDEYQRDNERCNQITQRAMRTAGACITNDKGQCLPLMPQFVTKLRQPATQAEALEQLGLCGGSLVNQAANENDCKNKAIPPQLAQFFRKKKDGKAGELVLPRETLEDNFCRMKQLAGGGIGKFAGTPNAARGITASGEAHSGVGFGR